VPLFAWVLIGVLVVLVVLAAIAIFGYPKDGSF
jgi:uncharacterized membrane protein